MHKNKNAGFTIVELMIATTVFSVILLLTTFSLIQIGRTYYKGTNSSRTQSVTRSISDQVTQAIQFSGRDLTSSAVSSGDLTPSDTGAVCVGNQRFSYIRNSIVTDSPSGPNQSRNALVIDPAPVSGCPSAITGGALPGNARELLAENMRLSDFRIIKNSVGYDVTIGVTSGPIELSDGTGGIPNGQCEGGPGNQFCANSQLKTVAKRRL